MKRAETHIISTSASKMNIVADYFYDVSGRLYPFYGSLIYQLSKL